MEDIKNIIECLLFVSESPLTVDAIKNVLNTADTRMVVSALNALSEEYETRRCGFFLREVAGGYQLRTRPEYNEYVKRLVQPPPPRLSKAALETLAIIAYKQPIIRADIEHIRGVDSGGIIRTLMERNLIRVLGRKEIPGRPLIYATTKQFLEVFDLKDLKDLPSPKEIEELTQVNGGDQTEIAEDRVEASSDLQDGPAPESDREVATAEADADSITRARDEDDDRETETDAAPIMDSEDGGTPLSDADTEMQPDADRSEWAERDAEAADEDLGSQDAAEAESDREVVAAEADTDSVAHAHDDDMAAETDTASVMDSEDGGTPLTDADMEMQPDADRPGWAEGDDEAPDENPGPQDAMESESDNEMATAEADTDSIVHAQNDDTETETDSAPVMDSENGGTPLTDADMEMQPDSDRPGWMDNDGEAEASGPQNDPAMESKQVMSPADELISPLAPASDEPESNSDRPINENLEPDR